jgi:hypothetical protein
LHSIALTVVDQTDLLFFRRNIPIKVGFMFVIDEANLALLGGNFSMEVRLVFVVDSANFLLLDREFLPLAFRKIVVNPTNLLLDNRALFIFMISRHDRTPFICFQNIYINYTIQIVIKIAIFMLSAMAEWCVYNTPYPCQTKGEFLTYQRWCVYNAPTYALTSNP